MTAAINIGSEGQFDGLLRSHGVVVVDFYADWCGPCKACAPNYEALATKHSKPGRIAFCKVNVDNQQGIAQRYNVRAMPTFIVFAKGSQMGEAIKGADMRALENQVNLAVTSAGSGSAFSQPGRTLGGTSGGGSSSSSGSAPTPRNLPRRSGQTLGGRPSSFNLFNILNVIITFFGLYFISLFSFDPYKAAERSAFNVHKPRDVPNPIKADGQKTGGSARRPGVRTVHDL